jgi:hypothetical protein
VRFLIFVIAIVVVPIFGIKPAGIKNEVSPPVTLITVDCAVATLFPDKL